MGAVPVGQVILAAALFSSARTYDAMGNVATVSTTLPAGTDTQAFCYDEQNRLTWASAATSTPPCGGSLSAGTLSAASYTQSFAYDTFGRLTSGPLGSYTYGPGMQAPAPAIPSPLHAALSAGSGYTATYDASGNMLCRAPTTSAGTCTTSTQTGQPLSYDNQGRLTHWQNLPSAPTSTADYAYDGDGQRVAQQVGGTGGTTTTYYLGGLEEVTVSGGTSTLTKYLSVPRVVTAVRVGTTLSYLATDGLGSESAALDSSGNVAAAQLFTPYGSMRYSMGTMPTAKGYTGQRADAASGLDYYNARYYDPALGQFVSADTVLPGGGSNPWGLSRYAYVGGNPEVRIDPTGHLHCPSTSCNEGGPGGVQCQPSNCQPTPVPVPTPTCGGSTPCPGAGGASSSSSSSGCSQIKCAVRTVTPVCKRTRDCHTGNDPDGLWALLKDLFGDATSVTVNGLDGLAWLKERLKDLLSRGDSILQDQANALFAASGFGVGFGAILLMFSAFPPAAIAGGGLVGAGVTSFGLALDDLLVIKQSFDDMMNDVIGKVGALEDELANGGVKNPGNYEVTVSEQLRPDPDPLHLHWVDQEFVMSVWQVTG